MKAFRWVLGASLASVVAWQSLSSATVVRAVPLGELVGTSEWVVVALVKSSRSHYETIGGAQRLVTDTLLQVEQAVTANRSSAGVETATISVRTLGGTLGELAQYVPGEAVLPQGTRQLLFLDEGSDGVFRVAAMAQGQYPIATNDQGQAVLQPSPGLDLVLNPDKSAVAALAGQRVEQAQAMVQNVRKVP
jgi:hypothetical protein